MTRLTIVPDFPGFARAPDTLVACPTKQMRPGIQQAPRICRGALRSGS